MATETDIANGALVRLGALLITSIDEPRKEARLCKARLGFCRDAVLRLHPWNSTITRVELASLAAAPAFEFTYQFQLPADCLRVLPDPEWSAHKIEGGRLLYDDTSIDLRYVARVAYTALDPLCAQALSLYLAWDICYAVTDSAALKQSIWAELQAVLPQARFVDSSEDPGQQLIADDYTSAHVSRGGYVRDPQT